MSFYLCEGQIRKNSFSLLEFSVMLALCRLLTEMGLSSSPKRVEIYGFISWWVVKGLKSFPRTWRDRDLETSLWCHDIFCLRFSF